ncbi:LuxR C-terminal-related transcriptional regulator [Microbacterium sp. NPDC078428]|uniref:LuxR C-terminal-related transcriptional regulator n=1 Tax=Microbacterium sp. NPDC078428 TaxID=3364190 RepID=UPI0037C5440D
MTPAASSLRDEAPPSLDLDPEDLLREISRRALEYWFRVPPERLHRALRRVDPELIAQNRAALVLYFATRGEGADDLPWITPPDAPPVPESLRDIVEVFRLLESGRPAAAARLMDRAYSHLLAGTAETHRTRDGGWTAAVALHTGTTRALAGDFGAAAADLARAGVWHVPDTLMCVPRDAHAMLALVHALVGDHRIAAWALRSLERMTPSDSWLEPEIDATARIAEASLTEPSARPAASDDRSLAAFVLDTHPAGVYRGRWPFLVWQLTRSLLRQERISDAETQIEQFRRARLPGCDGDGLPRSVLPCTAATVACLREDDAAAWRLLAEADPDCDLTITTTATTALQFGRYEQARAAAERLLDRCGELRGSRIAAIGVLTAAALRNGDRAGAEALLRPLAFESRPLARSEEPWLPSDVRELLGEMESESRRPTATPSPPAGLTRGDLEILALLDSPLSRQEIADRLFVSLNTVKSRIAGVYRKLGVASRGDAVAAARVRGVLG